MFPGEYFAPWRGLVWFFLFFSMVCCPNFSTKNRSGKNGFAITSSAGGFFRLTSLWKRLKRGFWLLVCWPLQLPLACSRAVFFGLWPSLLWRGKARMYLFFRNEVIASHTIVLNKKLVPVVPFSQLGECFEREAKAPFSPNFRGPGFFCKSPVCFIAIWSPGVISPPVGGSTRIHPISKSSNAGLVGKWIALGCLFRQSSAVVATPNPRESSPFSARCFHRVRYSSKNLGFSRPGSLPPVIWPNLLLDPQPFGPRGNKQNFARGRFFPPD